MFLRLNPLLLSLHRHLLAILPPGRSSSINPRGHAENPSRLWTLKFGAFLVFGVWCLVFSFCCGCKSIGPATVPRDRSEYSASIAESWKRQTLLNIVKLRYLDPPTFVDVGQIVSGYTLETLVSAGGNISSLGAVQGNSITAGGSARYTDRPTITYTPLIGAKYVRALMTPLPPEAVLYTVQSGWPANAVLFIAVGAMNGLKNSETSINGITPPDPNFMRALELLRQIQASGAVGLRVSQDAQKQQTTVLTFQTRDITQETSAEIKELRGLLHLDPEAAELKVAFGATATNDKELALQTRSMLHIMMTMAAQAEVPDQDIAQGRTPPNYSPTGPGAETTRLIRIHSSKSKPTDAYAEVYYRDHWFWIDDRDLKSKRAFAFMMMLFTLAEPGEKENLPLITIPAQ
jgi:hypothetical protein